MEFYYCFSDISLMTCPFIVRGVLGSDLPLGGPVLLTSIQAPELFITNDAFVLRISRMSHIWVLSPYRLMFLMPVFTAMISSPLFISFWLCVGCRFFITGLGSSKLGFGYIILFSISFFNCCNSTCICVWCVYGCIMSDVSGVFGRRLALMGLGAVFLCAGWGWHIVWYV